MYFLIIKNNKYKFYINNNSDNTYVKIRTNINAYITAGIIIDPITYTIINFNISI